MNVNEIIKSGIFSSSEDWNSFVELYDKRWVVQSNWLEKGTKQLMSQFLSSPYKGWSVAPFTDHNKYVDGVKLYLSEHGADSIMIVFGWDYELHLYLNNHEVYDNATVDKLLNLEEFIMIRSAFERIDRQFEWCHKAMHYRNFKMGSVNDGKLSREELAWFAGNKTDEFVKQCVAMIEKFTCDPVVTESLRELNVRSRVVTEDAKTI